MNTNSKSPSHRISPSRYLPPRLPADIVELVGDGLERARLLELEVLADQDADADARHVELVEEVVQLVQLVQSLWDSNRGQPSRISHCTGRRINSERFGCLAAGLSTLGALPALFERRTFRVWAPDGDLLRRSALGAMGGPPTLGATQLDPMSSRFSQ